MADDYIEFISHIKVKSGIDLALYKEGQMKRRLTSLRDKRGFSNFMTYYRELKNDKDLLKEFMDRITINVSEFYRNPKRWEVLKNIIVPLLAMNKKKLTIWSAACSTGEEPYSIALLLQEHFPEYAVNIIATDIDEKVLEKAQQGIYQVQALKDLPENLKKKYFTYHDGLYHIDPIVKRNITFKKHNLLADPYPGNMDLIICRNVLIYFTDEAKDLIYRNFSNSLHSNGVLFVGSTEQIFSPATYDLKIIETFFYQKQ